MSNVQILVSFDVESKEASFLHQRFWISGGFAREISMLTDFTKLLSASREHERG